MKANIPQLFNKQQATHNSHVPVLTCMFLLP